MAASRSWILYYDGDCPICQNFAAYVKFRQEFGHIELRSLREDDAFREIRQISGLDAAQLSKSFHLVSPEGLHYAGTDVFRMMDRIAADRPTSAGFDPYRSIYKHPWLMQWIYPVVRWVRHGMLRVLGRDPQLSDPDPKVKRLN